MNIGQKLNILKDLVASVHNDVKGTINNRFHSFDIFTDALRKLLNALH